MGFNPTRSYRGTKTVDIAILVVGMVIIGGLLAWALFG